MIQRLVEIVSKGGNYLLNIGPMADGTIPAPSVATLEKVGAWMQKNGESIYGTSACPLADFPWGRCTVKGERIYLHVFSWPADAVLRITGLNNPVRDAYALLDPSRKLPFRREHGVVSVSLPGKSLDDNDTVVVIEISGWPNVDPPLISQGSDSPFELDYVQATTAGNATKRFNRDGGFHISNWSSPSDSVTWRLLVSQTGAYKVRIRYAARNDWRGLRYEVSLGQQSLAAAVEPTGDWYTYQTFDLGTVSVLKAGKYSVTLRPATRSEHNLMYFKSLMLEPVDSCPGGADHE